MRPSKKLVAVCLFMASMGIFSSCHKAESVVAKHSVSQPQTAKRSAVVYQGDFSDWPNVEEDMLVFRDATHLSSYIDFLNNSITFAEEITDGSDTQDPNSILTGIENVINFQSLRNVTQTQFDALNEDGWATLAEVPDVHFINDIAIKSVLNANADVKVGTKITHFISRDYAATINADHADLLDGLHGLSTAATLTDIQALDYNDNITVQLLAQNSVVNTWANRGTGAPFNINGISVTTPDICAQPLKVKLDNLGLSTVFQGTGPGPISADFIVSWGDGTSNNYSTTSSNMVRNNIYHTYAVQGRKTISVTARATGPATGLPYDAQKDFIVDVPNSCNYLAQHTETAEIFDNYGMARSIRCKEWVEQWTSPFGYSKHSIGAKTQSIHLERNKWRSSRIDGVGASYTCTKSDGTCSNTWGDGRTTRNGNTDYAEATYTNQGFVGWTQVYCTHYARIGNNYITYSKTLTPCN